MTSEEQQALFDEVLQLFEASRLLAAGKSLNALKLSLTLYENSNISQLLDKHAKTIEKLVAREKESNMVLEIESVDDSWTSGPLMFGTRTHHKIVPGSGTILLRLEGELDTLPMFEQLAVIHEVSLFHEWVPFCNHSRLVTKLGPVEMIAYFGVFVPPLARNALLHAYGVDCLFEESKILLIGSSIDDWPGDTPVTTQPTSTPMFKSSGSEDTVNVQDEDEDTNTKKPSTSTSTSTSTSGKATQEELKNMPWKRPKTWFTDRMIIKDFKSILHITGPNTAKTVIIAQVDPQVPLPQSFINFIMKNLAGVFLTIFQRQVIKVAANPDTSHGQNIRGNLEFYEGWLLPKLRLYCDHKKWPQPTIKCLGHVGSPYIDTANTANAEAPSSSLGTHDIA